MSRPILYHYPESFSSQIVRLILAEKGVRWRSKVVDIIRSQAHYKPSYLELNPKMVVPTLVHDSLNITDSITIAIYINNNFPGPHLIPSRERERALTEKWLDLQQRFLENEFTYASLSGMGLALARQDFARRKDKLRRYAKKYEEYSEYYTAKYEDVCDLEAYLGNSAFAEQQATSLSAIFDMMEELLRLPNAEWLCGEDYSIADAVWTVTMARLEMLGYAELWQDGEHPFVDSFYDRVQNRPSWKKAEIVNKVAPAMALNMVFGLVPYGKQIAIGALCLGAGYGLAQVTKALLST